MARLPWAIYGPAPARNDSKGRYVCSPSANAVGVKKAMVNPPTKHNTNRDPFFSVIVPVWNRAEAVVRCLDSCLKQDFTDFEIIVVDDGSKDDTLEVLRRYEGQDSRIHAITLGKRPGVSVARNFGAKEARGEWLIYLDSDDAFLPGGMQQCYEAIAEAPEDVGIIGLAYACGNFGTSPRPLPPSRRFDLYEYVRWAMTAKSTDYLPLHRRSCWQAIPWPDCRVTEGVTTLRLVMRFGFFFANRIVGVVYTDATNRFTATERTNIAPKSSYRDSLRVLLEGLEELGDCMKEKEPGYYASLLREAALLAFSSGAKMQAVGYSIRSLRIRPLSMKSWTVLFFGCISRRALIRVRAAIRKLRATRRLRSAVKLRV